MFELDGRIQRTYSENLCLVAKLFLDHKTLRFDCEPFHFYVLTERRPIINKSKSNSNQASSKGGVEEESKEVSYSHHFCGYFSKEKGWSVENNLSCILVMPYCQRKGYGKFLIEFSYELSIKEGRTGTPERPLSDLGFRSYISWWAARILTLLLENSAHQLSIAEISEQTAIDVNDVLYVLENFKVLRKINNQQILFTQREYLEEILRNLGRPGRKVFRDKLLWIPHIFK